VSSTVPPTSQLTNPHSVVRVNASGSVTSIGNQLSVSDNRTTTLMDRFRATTINHPLDDLQLNFKQSACAAGRVLGFFCAIFVYEVRRGSEFPFPVGK